METSLPLERAKEYLVIQGVPLVQVEHMQKKEVVDILLRRAEAQNKILFDLLGEDM